MARQPVCANVWAQGRHAVAVWVYLAARTLAIFPLVSGVIAVAAARRQIGRTWGRAWFVGAHNPVHRVAVFVTGLSDVVDRGVGLAARDRIESGVFSTVVARITCVAVAIAV